LEGETTRASDMLNTAKIEPVLRHEFLLKSVKNNNKQ